MGLTEDNISMKGIGYKEMIGYIKGEVAAIYEDRLVLENNGIGYNIYMPGSSLELVEGIGAVVKVYTYLCVREDAMLLYGFLTKDALDLYRLLISVGGIGPKGGLSLLSVMSADELKFAIASGDVKQIAKAPGIGAKTAQRIVLELQDKVSALGAEPGKAPAAMSQSKEEALGALVMLGFPKAAADKVLQSLDGSLTVEELIKEALKRI